ncbi:MAG: sugar transferase [Acidimicrobiales bacterium]
MRKRIFDVAMSATLLMVTLPLVLALAVLLGASLRAWPVFTQIRVGQNGRPFRFLKLRTLPPTADPYADKYRLGTVETPAVARLVRRSHLDELPQLLLVLTGRMSLVGPRPEMPPLHADMPEWFAGERVSVRPGCTGLWQISKASDGLISESPEYDRFYVRHQSIRFDLWILAHTVPVMAARRAKITFDDLPEWCLQDQPAVTVPNHR